MLERTIEAALKLSERVEDAQAESLLNVRELGRRLVRDGASPETLGQALSAVTQAVTRLEAEYSENLQKWDRIAQVLEADPERLTAFRATEAARRLGVLQPAQQQVLGELHALRRALLEIAGALP